MPTRLERYQHSRQMHYVTFTCYHRRPLLMSAAAKAVFEQTLERVRRWYDFYISAYVVMPEHVHLLVSEPERAQLSVALQMLKQIVSRKLKPAGSLEPFWQHRYYDFNVWSETKFKEKRRYIHRNPVRRGLVEKPEDWPWSSYRHWLTGVEGTVEIESQWTALKREQMGIVPQIKRRSNE
jgi:putative transposase